MVKFLGLFQSVWSEFGIFAHTRNMTKGAASQKRMGEIQRTNLNRRHVK